MKNLKILNTNNNLDKSKSILNLNYGIFKYELTTKGSPCQNIVTK